MRLDLYTNNQQREVERLIGLGARPYPWRYGPDADYVVLEDPDGNLFCAVEVAEEQTEKALGAKKLRSPVPWFI